jgi:lipid-A-disaccharide synthase
LNLLTRSCPIAGPTFFLTAAEHSGDSLGAALIPALRARHPDAFFVGIGGEKMAAAGCRILANPTAHSAMLLGAASQAFYWIRQLRELKREFARYRPDVVIPIDSPAINLRIARLAKDMQFPVCFYVAPQLWAWAEWRMKKVRAAVDTLCCVLPFEEAYFKQHDIHAVYVGHPMFDTPSNLPQTDPKKLDPPLPIESPKVALLPGSRKAEIAGNLPAMLATLSEIKGRFPNVSFVAAAPSEERAWQIRHHLRHVNTPVEIRVNATDAVIRWADLVMTVSGTATLQVAKHAKPMIVMYALARYKWHLAGRWLVKTPYMSLVNILANRELVPEFMPFYGSPLPIAREAVELLSRPELRDSMTRGLIALTTPLHPAQGHTAAERVAEEVDRLMAAGRSAEDAAIH